MSDPLESARAFVTKRCQVQPLLGLVLGSGLGPFADAIETVETIEYAQIPHCPVGRVAGHAQQLKLGHLAGTPVAALVGRIHFYETGDLAEVVFPVRLLAALGCRAVIQTNAAGAVNPAFEVGQLMLIRDHVNLLGSNPLFASADAAEPHFLDLTAAYDRALNDALRQAAERVGVSLAEGVYAANRGPVYETPAEVRMLRQLGIDAVGMSTVAETIALRHAGVRVAAISCLTNLAAGIADRPLSHAEVLETGRDAAEGLAHLLKSAVPDLAQVLAAGD